MEDLNSKNGQEPIKSPIIKALEEHFEKWPASQKPGTEALRQDILNQPPRGLDKVPA